MSSPTHSAPPDADGRRALVLGGGGSTGNAWLLGLVAGLYEAGLDVATTADVTIGTSAGATAAAQLGGATPTELFTAVLDTPPPQRPVTAGASGQTTRAGATNDHLDRLRATIAAANDAADLRHRVARAALEAAAASDGSWRERWRATVASRLPGTDWPQRLVQLTALDVRTGEAVVFDRHGGIDLVDAVAASCAGGSLPYPIGDDLYLDGGYRANADNADLASGYGRVLVLSPLSGRSLHPRHWGTHLADQVDALRAAGSRVEVVAPDRRPDVFGANAMDVTLRPAAAEAGHEQGLTLAGQLADLWG